MCVLGLASLSLSQLAAFSSDWLLNEGALQGNEHGTNQRDKKVLITQQSAENGIWASHAPSSSVTPGQMLTLWPFVILQNQPRVSHKQKIWVSYVPWEIKQQKKKRTHVLLISFKLVHPSEQKSKDQKLSPTSGTYHSFELNANAFEQSTLSTHESSCPSQLNILRCLLGKSINAQRLSQLHILFFCKHDLMWVIGMLKRKNQKWKMSNSCSTTQVICNFLLLEFKMKPLIRKALSIDFPVQSCRGAGVHPSCQGVERRVTSLTDIYAHPI